MGSRYSYAETLAAAERVHWRVEDLIGGDKRLDWQKPFLPESLARVAALDFLTPADARTLNQVRGHAYLSIFGLVEEFILPFVLDHVRPMLGADIERTRAFLQFATEEAKHIHLFERFREDFEGGFGSACGVIGPPEAVAREVLSHHPLAVALVILHIEWMTQRHYVESVKDDQQLDPQFTSLLRHHWMEEAQHAKLDTLMVETLAAACTPEEIDRALDEYLEIGGFLDQGLAEQTRLDLKAWTQARGRAPDVEEEARFVEVQRQANRWTYLGSGMTHPQFLTTLGELRPAARQRIEEVSQAFC